MATTIEAVLGPYAGAGRQHPAHSRPAARECLQRYIDADGRDAGVLSPSTFREIVQYLATGYESARLPVACIDHGLPLAQLRQKRQERGAGTSVTQTAVAMARDVLARCPPDDDTN
jgi:hypothetical protein